MSTDTATQGLREVPLRLVVEDRGFLLAGQVFDQVPFHVARFFVVGNVPSGEVRGRHAHRAGEQLLVALAGSLVVDAWSGADHQRHVLRAGGTALHVPPGTFTCQSQFSGGALLLVLCSNTYDVADYIEAEEFFAGSRYSSTPEAMGARADG